MNDDLATLYYGTTQPVEAARRVEAGPWSAWLADGALREIRFDGVEVIRAIAFLVRDKDWGTCRPQSSGLEIDTTEQGFHVAYRAHCENPDGAALAYRLTVQCAADGALHVHASVSVADAFVTARCGFCVLHPLEHVAGAPARVEHGDGTLECAAFPHLIDPWQPFKDIRAIEHDLGERLRVRCAFTGDVFEMEDQRNWSDASFKTYSRPLEWPWPYTLDARTTFEQSVTLSVATRVNVANLATTSLADRESEQTLTLEAIGNEPPEPPEPLPALGVAIAAHEIDDALANLALIDELGAQQLTLSFDPTAGHGLRELQRFAAVQRETRLPAVLEYALPGIDAPRAELTQLAQQIAAARIALSGVVVSPAVHRQSNPPGSVSPPCPPLDDVYREARRALPGLRIGGGMLSYFTELNRKRPPLELVDWVTHATCPIVHAADDVSVMQTLDAIPHITRSCRALIGARPYAIGPVSIGMRQNPYGSRVMPNPHGERVAMAAADPRQHALFGAAWLAGYAAALADAGIETLTLGALIGARGVGRLAGAAQKVERYPMFHVAKGLAQMSGKRRVRCTFDARAIACVASRDDAGRVGLLIANLTAQTQTVRLVVRDGTQRDLSSAQAWRLDERSAEAAAFAHTLPFEALSLEEPLTLLPFATVGLQIPADA